MTFGFDRQNQHSSAATHNRFPSVSQMPRSLIPSTSSLLTRYLFRGSVIPPWPLFYRILSCHGAILDPMPRLVLTNIRRISVVKWNSFFHAHQTHT